MNQVSRNVSIAAPVGEVWSSLAEFGAISGWADNVDHSCLLSDQTEDVGMVRRNQVGRNTVVETVDVWSPPNKLGYEITGLPPALRQVRNEWELSEQGPYTTATLTTTVEIGPRPPQQGIERVVAARMAKMSVQMLEGLARLHNTPPTIAARS